MQGNMSECSGRGGVKHPVHAKRPEVCSAACSDFATEHHGTHSTPQDGDAPPAKWWAHERRGAYAALPAKAARVLAADKGHVRPRCEGARPLDELSLV